MTEDKPALVCRTIGLCGHDVEADVLDAALPPGNWWLECPECNATGLLNVDTSRSPDDSDATDTRTAHDLGLCEHEVEPHTHDDSALPRHVWRLECPICGAMAEYDAQDDQLTSDF